MSPEQMGFSSDGAVLGDAGTLGQDQCHRKQRKVLRHDRWLKSEDRRTSGAEKLSDVLRGLSRVDDIQQEGQTKIEQTTHF